MRVYDEGSFVRVSVSRNEVNSFKRTWPCSGLPNRSISFTFDKRNGDLVDLNPSFIDGEAAVALSHDAGNYAAHRLELNHWIVR